MIRSGRRNAVVAHFDATRALAPHTRYLLDRIADVCDRIVVVSTSGIDRDGQAWLGARPRITFTTRPNVGYDFKSLQVGYQLLNDPGGADILFCNDSFIGPFVSLDKIFRTMDHRAVDFWGMTKSYEIKTHVQSYFMVFKSQVCGSPVFRHFWQDFGTPANRAEAIEQGELRLTGLLEEAGFSSGAYYEATPEEIVLANRRLSFLHSPEREGEEAVTRWWRAHSSARIRSDERLSFNPTITLADAALHGSLPLLKLEAIRLDPAELGGAALGAALADVFPQAFEGVDKYIADTNHLYRGRYRPKGLRDRLPKLYADLRYAY
ncbi:rhamnan synthesis F family protein [Brevibacterium litoralis]|uniref:rhamnan synthesis F family protein n=1 Tax=Brevibacterium litoralis TaxID=3138935 RepID=UPI0032EC736A